MDSEATTKYPYFSEESSAEVVIARMSPDADPRFREIMSSVIRHLHAVVKEVRPTQEIRRKARHTGMRTLLEDGLNKALKGLTTLDEVLSICHHEASLVGG